MWNHFSFTESDGGKERYNRPGILECVEHGSINISDESAVMSSDSSCEDFEVNPLKPTWGRFDPKKRMLYKKWL